MAFSQDFLNQSLNSKIYDMHNASSGFVFLEKERLWHEKTPFQTIDIIENDFFGRMLFIDGTVMLTDKDEFIYHEMISHVPAFAHPSPKKALVLGGGDGGVLRELSKHSQIEELILVEIDQRVLDLSREFFPKVAKGLDHQKSEIVIEDAFDYLKKLQQQFDLIITDSTDPYGCAENLFQVEFYQKISKALVPNGIFVAQTESAFYYPETLRKIYQNLRKVFPFVSTYWASIPTYPTGGWSFCFCSNDSKFDLSQSRVLENKSSYTNFLKDLKYYNPELQQASFCLPNHIRKVVDIVQC